MTTARSRPIVWDIYEEHLSEAAFLWGEWETALAAANYALGDVAVGPEERLAAHLDGLVLGGRSVAEKLLLPELEGNKLKLVCPAAWVLLQSEDADHFDVVLGALAGAEPPKAAAVARAMGLCRHPSVVPRLSPLWTHGGPALRAVILKVLARHDFAWVAARVPEALRADDPSLFATALGLVRWLSDRDPGFVRYVEQGLASDDDCVRAEAIATGFVLGSKGIWKACQRAVAAPGTDHRPFAFLALSADEKDHELLRGCLKDPATVRQALWALGFAGDVDSADALTAFLADEKLGALAAEAFSAITGLAIDGRFRAVGETRGPDKQEVAIDDPPPEVRPEDHLPAPAAAAVAVWWQKNRGRFPPRTRHVAGGPRNLETLRTAMIVGPMWRREVVALEIAAGTRGAVGDLTGWTREQLRGTATSVGGKVRL